MSIALTAEHDLGSQVQGACVARPRRAAARATKSSWIPNAATLKPVFENPAVAAVNQSIKYDLLVLAAQGVSVANIAGDPMVAHYLLHAGERSHNLDELTRTYLGH